MKIYDLSGKLAPGLWYYGNPYISYTSKRIATMQKNGYIASEIHMTTHTGTHIECGRHWGDDKQAIDTINLETFIGPARMLDITAKSGPLCVIDREKLKEAGGDGLRPGDICVIYTGWDKNWSSTNYVIESPFLTLDGARYLIERKIKLFAADFPIIGDPADGISFVPQGIEVSDYIFMDNNILVVLGLTNLAQLPKEFTFAAFPLRIEGGDGSPVRAVAWI